MGLEREIWRMVIRKRAKMVDRDLKYSQTVVLINERNDRNNEFEKKKRKSYEE